MSTFLVIGVALGLWSVVVLVVLAACWAAGRGDEVLPGEALTGNASVSKPAIEEPAADPASPRVRLPVPRGLIGRPRLH